MTLIDLNGELGRVDGGVGLALEEPKIEVKVDEADDLSVRGPLKDRAEDAARRVLGVLDINSGVSVEVTRDYPQHVGLGSGTQVALAVGKGICELYGVHRSTRQIAEMVGRGGTSGIGTAAFEDGGFIIDGGHSRRIKPDFLPSSASRAPPPPVIGRYDFPDWKVVLVIPKERGAVSGRREVDIFRDHCPVPLEDVQALSHLILMKLMPAVLEEDIHTFGEAINTIQTLGFKKVEMDLQSSGVKEILDICQENSPGAGLSSFGPVVYSITDDERPLLDAMEGREDIEDIIVTKAANHGVVIK